MTPANARTRAEIGRKISAFKVTLYSCYQVTNTLRPIGNLCRTTTEEIMSGRERDGTLTDKSLAPAGLSGEDQYDLKVTRVEFADLRARLIALESVTISLLLTASDRQLELAREMADHIAPREGYTPHPLTLDAANHVNQLVDRALRLRLIL